MFSVGLFLLALVLVSAMVRLMKARQGKRAGSTEKWLEAISQFAFGGLNAYWAHRIYAPYANQFEPAYEAAVIFAGFILGFLAAVDVFKNMFSTETGRAAAHLAIAGFLIVSLVAASGGWANRSRNSMNRC